MINIKKPEFWDFKKPNFLSYLLLPFTLPIRVSNFLLDNSFKIRTKKFFTICVGNIYVGGTGKTPTSIKLYKILNKLNFKVLIAKKYYPEQIDEIKMLRENASVISGITRKIIIKKTYNKANILIFDDGLQDKKIDYNLKFVCFDGKTWIGNGFLLPAGPLREELKSLKKYDGVFLKNSKSFDIKIIKKINPKIKIFLSHYEITNLNKFNLSNNFLIFSGIGNPKDFKNILIKNNFKIIRELIYPDHFKYRYDDIISIKKLAKKLNAKIITTEKDFAKLSKKDKKNINFIKIDLKIKNEKNLINFIKYKLNETN